MKNIKSLFRMSLNGLHCLSETFSNEPPDTKWFQFAMHSRQNQEEKLHLLFCTKMLRVPSWKALNAQLWTMLFLFSPLTCWPGTGKTQTQRSTTELLQNKNPQTVQAANREALSVAGTMLNTDWLEKEERKRLWRWKRHRTHGPGVRATSSLLKSRSPFTQVFWRIGL